MKWITRVIAGLLLTGAVHAADFAVTYDFVPGTDILAPEVNTNFGDVEYEINHLTGERLVDGTVTAADLAANSVTSAKISDDAVTKDKLNSDVAGSGIGQAGDGALTVNVDNSTVEVSSDTLRVKDSGITSAKIADGTIVNADISNSAAIGYSKLNLAGGITSSDIKNGEIVNEDISASAGIGYSKLNLTNSIVSGDIADGTITSSDLGPSSVTAAKINADVAGDGLGQSSGALKVNVDGSTIEIVGDTLQAVPGASIVPTGVIMDWAGGSMNVPTGWLLCDGSAVSRTTYAALFAVIGTTYGSGDGSTTFNLPDSRDRVSVGAGSTYALGQTMGSATNSHTHSAGSYKGPSHTHAVNSHTHSIPSHTHNYGSLFACIYQPYGGTSLWAWNETFTTWTSNRESSNWAFPTHSSGGHDTAGTVIRGNTGSWSGSTGASSPSPSSSGTGSVTGTSGTPSDTNNMQPSIAFYKIIKY